MKKALLALIIILSSLVNSVEAQKFGEDYYYVSDSFISVSHQEHSLLGAAFGVPGYFIGLDITDGDRGKAILIGGGIGGAANLLKEVTDIGKTGFNVTDILFGWAGGTASAWASDKLFYNNWRENKRQEVEELEAQRIASLTDEEKLLDKL